MGFKRVTLRSASTLSAGVVQHFDLEGCRGAECVVLQFINNADAATLTTFVVERKNPYGADGYAGLSDVAITGDVVVGQRLNQLGSSGTVSAGRSSRITFAGGCPWNVLRVTVQAGGAALGALSIDAFIGNPAVPDDTSTFQD